MGTMIISLPNGLKAFVDEQAARRGYGSSSEYIRELIRREQDKVQFKDLILDGAARPRTGEADASYFDSLRSRVSTGTGFCLKKGPAAAT
jgi:antitoxin ParD1/3/4